VHDIEKERRLSVCHEGFSPSLQLLSVFFKEREEEEIQPQREEGKGQAWRVLRHIEKSDPTSLDGMEVAEAVREAQDTEEYQRCHRCNGSDSEGAAAVISERSSKGNPEPAETEPGNEGVVRLHYSRTPGDEQCPEEWWIEEAGIFWRRCEYLCGENGNGTDGEHNTCVETQGERPNDHRGTEPVEYPEMK